VSNNGPVGDPPEGAGAVHQSTEAPVGDGIQVERGQIVDVPGGGVPVPEGAAPGTGEGDEAAREAVSEPAKVMRVGSMIKQLLDEVRETPLDDPGRQRLRDIYERSITELGAALSDDLREELERLVFPFRSDEVPTDIELRIGQAQLVGWLEGLFHGIQATLFAQQMAARQQLERMRQLPPGAEPGDPRPGTYL
jgi:hypothetical protein